MPVNGRIVATISGGEFVVKEGIYLNHHGQILNK
jgi:hypothetical protein